MRRKIVLAAVLVVAAAVVAAFTVPITVGGKAGPPQPGSADYAAPLASTALPPVPPKFGGEIKPVEKESKVWWPPTAVPPKGAPNVLLIMTDDVGSDTGTPVEDRDYKVPFRFNGKLARLTLSLDRPKLTPADEQRLMQTAKRN